MDDDGESVKLGFQNLPCTSIRPGALSESTVSITDDDTAGVTVSDTSLDIDEGDSDTYTVVLGSQTHPQRHHHGQRSRPTPMSPRTPQI